MRAFLVEEYRPDYHLEGEPLPLRLTVFRVVMERERAVWDRVGVQHYPGTCLRMTLGRRAIQRRELRRYCRRLHPGFPVFTSGVRSHARVTAAQAKKLTGLTHPMAAIDKLRELVEEGIDNGTLTGTYRVRSGELT
jgi:hypothetical protein